MTKPCFQYVGAKSEFADWIVSQLPPHRTFVDCCGGGASVLLAKEPSAIDVFNDVNYQIAGFFKTLRDREQELVRAICLSPYHRGEYDRAKASLERDLEQPYLQPVERARLFYIVARQSMGGRFGSAWSSVKTHSRRGMASSCSRWLNAAQELYAVAERFQRVQIEELDVVDLLRKYDSPETLHYIDPPYVPSTRSKKLYAREMTVEQHERLLNACNGLDGKVVVSGYRNELYESWLGSWRSTELEVACRSNVKTDGAVAARPQRIEKLWMNYPLKEDISHGEHAEVSRQ